MSRTKQRKLSAYQQGYEDGSTTGWFRWKRHPYLAQYRRGYTLGSLERRKKRAPVEPDKRKGFWASLLDFISRKGKRRNAKTSHILRGVDSDPFKSHDA